MVFFICSITSNPFNYIFPIPQEGLGLNPILQDPALAIHPPLLYLGYVGSSIIFSASLAAVAQNYISKEWGTTYKKMGFNFLDFFNYRYYAWVNLGLL